MPDEDARLLRELHDEHAQALWRYVVHLTGDRDAIRQAAVDAALDLLARRLEIPAGISR